MKKLLLIIAIAAIAIAGCVEDTASNPTQATATATATPNQTATIAAQFVFDKNADGSYGEHFDELSCLNARVTLEGTTAILTCDYQQDDVNAAFAEISYLAAAVETKYSKELAHDRVCVVPLTGGIELGRFCLSSATAQKITAGQKIEKNEITYIPKQ